MFFDYLVYVACSLTCAPPEFRAEVEVFKGKLKSICRILYFYGLDPTKSPYEVYRWDIHECVSKSDLVVAICDLPSIGLGYEMGTQVEARHMPCLALAHEKSLVSDLILDTRQPGFDFKRYRYLHTEGVTLVAEKLKKMHELERRQPLLFPELARLRYVA